MQSLKFEHKLYTCIKEKMEEMQQHNMSWIEVSYCNRFIFYFTKINHVFCLPFLGSVFETSC